MKLSGQLHALAALPPEKEPPVLTQIKSGEHGGHLRALTGLAKHEAFVFAL
jgi:hypothetical protein